MFGQGDIREGMTVFSADGEKLGKIKEMHGNGFIIEKGIFFKDNYAAGLEHIAEIRGDDILLTLNKDQLGIGYAGAAGWQAGEGEPGRRPAGREAEVRMPLAEEELQATKRTREAGEVRVRKDVVTEQKHISVPVTREEVYVERTPVREGAKPGEATFERSEVSVPVYEEEVEVTKRPVVREEVRVGKTQYQEQRTASGETRREVAEVDEEREPGIRRRLDEDEDKKKL